MSAIPAIQWIGNQSKRMPMIGRNAVPVSRMTESAISQ